MIKARVHLVMDFPDSRRPFSLRLDVLALTRDPQWVYGQAASIAQQQAKIVKGQPATINPLSIEWIEV